MRGRVRFLVLLLPVLIAAAPEPAPSWLERLVSWATGGDVVTTGLRFGFGGSIRADTVALKDPNGVWLTIEGIALEMQPLRLFAREVRIDRLEVAKVTMLRTPVSSGGSGSMPLRVVLTNGHLARLEIDKAVAGEPVAVSVDAPSLTLPSLQAGSFDATVRNLNEAGTYSAAGSLDANALSLRLNASEPANGLVARIAGMHDFGALSVSGSVDGPRNNAAVDLTAMAGETRLHGSGHADIGQRSGDVQVDVAALAMTPVAGITWQSASVHAHVTGSLEHPHADAALVVQALQAREMTAQKVNADVSGDPSRFTAQVMLEGLQVPGLRSGLLPSAPLTLNATVAMNGAAQASVDIAAAMDAIRASAVGQVNLKDRSGDLELMASLPAMAPAGEVAWQSASLRAHLSGPLTQPHGTGTLSIEKLAAAGATAEQLQADVSADPDRIGARASLTGLRIPGPRPDVFTAAPLALNAEVALNAPGQPARISISHPVLDVTASGATEGPIEADVMLQLKNVAALEPSVRGTLSATGHLVGTLNDLALNADAKGELAAGAMPPAFITTSVQARNITGAPIGTIVVSAVQANDRARLDAALDERGVARLRLVADAAGVRANAAGAFDVHTSLLLLSEFAANYHGQQIGLASPARISLAGGVTIESLRLSLRQAVLSVSGRATPALDLTAALRDLPLSVADQFVPNLGAQGTINADVRLGGTLSAPTGTARMTASGLRLATGAAGAFPPGSANATATLAGATARIDANASIRTARLTLTGTAPLNAGATLALRSSGAIDLALFNRVLAANGTIVNGRASFDATIDGSLSAPRVAGTLQLANGELQIVPQGVRLRAIEARLAAIGESLRIERLTARAGGGTINGSGSVGLSAPLPFEITITAHNAQPLSSDLVTATMDADLTLRGAVENSVTVGGTLTLDETNIRVPEKLPSSIAVLNVVNLKGPQPAAPSLAPSSIGLDLTVNAPSRVWVRGRGLDAEFAGAFRLGGTAAAPRPDGRLRLRRGTFDLVGKALTFTSGTIGLDGSGRLDPTLDFTATNTLAATVSTLKITGYASNPQFLLTSSPPLPQDQILARLLFGRDTSSLSVFQLAEIASGIAQLTGIGGNGLNPLERVRSTLGLDTLSVGGQNGKTNLTVGRQISEGITIGARQSASGQGSAATVDFDLGRGFQLQTAVGTAGTSATSTGSAGGSSLGINWQFQY
jgi:autotransporter translocation and assembly factor TamB